MAREEDRSDVVTGPELILVLIGLAALIVPIFLLKVHRDNELVQQYLGGWKVVAFWVVTFGILYWIEMLLRKLGWGRNSAIDE